MRPDEDWESYVAANPGLVTYQLFIDLKSPQKLVVGRLGCFDFPVGRYVYTGSARKNMLARVRRHLSRNKTIRWHIDYLLNAQDAQIVVLDFSDQPECKLNQQSDGKILIPGFGASDCRADCHSHLKYMGEIS